MSKLHDINSLKKTPHAKWSNKNSLWGTASVITIKVYELASHFNSFYLLN